MAAPILRVHNLSVTYPGVRPVKALEDISLEIYPGEFVVVAGVSGSGKSTLLRAINRLAENDHARIEGDIYFDGVNILQASRRQIREVRSRIGFIFQEYNVVERSPVLTNALVGALARVGLWRSLLGRSRQIRSSGPIRRWCAWGFPSRATSIAPRASPGGRNSAWGSPAPCCKTPSSS
jgi:phosphonate transport system ATP-binding protein